MVDKSLGKQKASMPPCQRLNSQVGAGRVSIKKKKKEKEKERKGPSAVSMATLVLSSRSSFGSANVSLISLRLFPNAAALSLSDSSVEKTPRV